MRLCVSAEETAIDGDGIPAGKIASVLAVILVIAFMAATYGMFGLLADVALIMNLILILNYRILN